MPKRARTKPSAELRRLRAQCAVFNTAFLTREGVPPETMKSIAVELEHNFGVWWDSWVEPELEYLEKRGF